MSNKNEISDDQNGIVISLVKKVNKIVIDGNLERIKAFAKKLVENEYVKWDVVGAYNDAFIDVQKVRASNILQETSVWECIISELKSKTTKSKIEKQIIKNNEIIKEVFQLSPFELYNIYVENNNGSTIAESLNIDCSQCFSTLIYLNHYFKLLNRDYFYKMCKNALAKEMETMEAFGKKHEMDRIIQMARKDGIDFSELVEDCGVV